jgi:cupin fold WbuC family metalloprotein
MFLITIDKTGRLLVEQTDLSADGNPHRLACLPAISNDSSRDEVNDWLHNIGAVGASVIEFVDICLSTRAESSKYALCGVDEFHPDDSKFEMKSLDSLWKQEIGISLAVAMSQVVKQVEAASPGAVQRFEKQLLQDFNLNKVSPRVFFAKSETVVANESLISFLGAFAVANGQKTARLCMHQDQNQVIQEMLMIHAEQISTGPLRQDRDSSVSYHMMRGALEITLHHGEETGDTVYRVEHSQNQPSANSSLRVPARVFRTIRTLTDSAVFIEAQSGPFSDSDTEWAEGTARR